MDDEDCLDDMLAEQEMMEAELAAEAEAHAAMLAVAQVIGSLASWTDDHDGWSCLDRLVAPIDPDRAHARADAQADASHLT